MTHSENTNNRFQMVCVVAMANNGVIGDGQGLIWHLPGDLPRVKKITMGCPLIMGRRTWASIGKALPGRASIVLTRDTSWTADGAIVAHSLSDAIMHGKSWLARQESQETRLILFGGGEIYSLGIDLCQEIELTRVNATPPSGTKFPNINWQEWDELDATSHKAGEDHPGFSYHRYIYKTKNRFV